ncbi:hypothetical protein NUW58_g10721 [Xylaria curta]|uniref:Uncharacterized protein n=1 Tax=Xylaria curta TaxID=42375 RepID=A0ACC1MHJ1_9PEZI|nr:hypothetical protein NUW58_g10721 [Xylaria curta]
MRVSADVDVPPDQSLQVAGRRLIDGGHELDEISVDSYYGSGTDAEEVDARLRFRNASDPQLSSRWRQQQQAAEKPPPMPERMVPPLLPSFSRVRHLLTRELGFSSCHHHNGSYHERSWECHGQEVGRPESLADAPFDGCPKRSARPHISGEGFGGQ